MINFEVFDQKTHWHLYKFILNFQIFKIQWNGTCKIMA